MNIGVTFDIQGGNYSEIRNDFAHLNFNDTVKNLEKIQSILEKNIQPLDPELRKLNENERRDLLLSKAILLKLDYINSHTNVKSETIHKIDDYIAQIALAVEVKPSYFDALPSDLISNLIWQHLDIKDIDSFAAINSRNKNILLLLARNFGFDGDAPDAAPFLKNIISEWRQFLNSSDISISLPRGSPLADKNHFSLPDLVNLRKEIQSNAKLLEHLSSRLRVLDSTPESLNKISMLLSLGADPTLSINGYSALHHIAAKGQLEVAQLVLEKTDPAFIDEVDPQQFTPLMRASEVNLSKLHKKNIERRLHLCLLLLEKGADVNVVTLKGTALDFAIQNKDRRLTKLLLAYGADPFLLNTKNSASEWFNKLTSRLT